MTVGHIHVLTQMFACCMSQATMNEAARLRPLACLSLAELALRPRFSYVMCRQYGDCFLYDDLLFTAAIGDLMAERVNTEDLQQKLG